jgi:DNA-binding transcriptional LysR family regulator
MRSIPMDVLRAFVAVVEARGFTRAGEALGRTQPTISLQVKRLEELIEAPLFEKAARFELTPIGDVCFDYGKRLLRLHDDMLDEASRRKSPGAAIRVGLPSGLSGPLAQHIACLGDETDSHGFEIITGASTELGAAFRQNGVDVAVLIAEDADASARWRAPLAWFGGAPKGRHEPLRIVVPPADSPVHQAAISALRMQERKFEIVCASNDFAALIAAAAAGLGVAPILEGLSPAGLKRSTERSLPPLPPVTLSLLSHSAQLTTAGRRWVSQSLPNLELI